MSKLTLINGKIRHYSSSGSTASLVLSPKPGSSNPCCCDPCAYVLCISVIDEDEATGSATVDAQNRNADWVQFRASWPDRQFFLLQPLNSTYSSSLQLPIGWNGVGPIIVARDNGNVAAASDWYALCDLDNNLSVGGKVALFVDNSGSMTTATVQASYNLFLSRLTGRLDSTGQPDPVTVGNGRLLLVSDGNERWILPHISFQDCPVEYSGGG